MINSTNPNMQIIFCQIRFLKLPIMVLSFATSRSAIPIMGAIVTVIPCAKTIRSNGNFPYFKATIAPMTITNIMNFRTTFNFKSLPSEKASESNAPPIVAFPIKEENEALNNPSMKIAVAKPPYNGFKANPMSVAEFT